MYTIIAHLNILFAVLSSFITRAIHIKIAMRRISRYMMISRNGISGYIWLIFYNWIRPENVIYNDNKYQY